MGRLDLADKRRDEDNLQLWTADASRAIARGDYVGAIEILIESGQERSAAERFVVVTVAINAPRQIHNRRLGYLVGVAQQAMTFSGWTFSDVADAVQHAQAGLGEA